MTKRLMGAPSRGYFQRLLEHADKRGIQLEFLPEAESLDHRIDWDGLYLYDDEYGAGIAINERLSNDWLIWVLGHEVGHDHHLKQGTLFSPFEGAVRCHKTDPRSRKRWGQWKRLSLDEELANEWAAEFLIDRAGWAELERAYPCELDLILKELALPRPAAISWERLRRKRQPKDPSRLVRLAESQVDVLCRPIVNQGGHQSCLRRVVESRSGSRVRVTYRDFSYARTRILTVGGGYYARYRVLLDAMRPAIVEAGGVDQFFLVQDEDPQEMEPQSLYEDRALLFEPTAPEQFCFEF